MIARVFEKAVQNITGDEIEKTLKKLKAGKGARLAGVAMEYLEMGGTRGVGACWLKCLMQAPE